MEAASYLNYSSLERSLYYFLSENFLLPAALRQLEVHAFIQSIRGLSFSFVRTSPGLNGGTLKQSSLLPLHTL